MCAGESGPGKTRLITCPCLAHIPTKKRRVPSARPARALTAQRGGTHSGQALQELAMTAPCATHESCSPSRHIASLLRHANHPLGSEHLYGTHAADSHLRSRALISPKRAFLHPPFG